MEDLELILDLETLILKHPKNNIRDSIASIWMMTDNHISKLFYRGCKNTY